MKTTHRLALTTLATVMAAGSAFAQQPTTPRTTQSPTEQTRQAPPTQQQTQQGQQSQMGARDHERGRDMDKPSYSELNARGDDRVSRTDLAAHPKLMEKFDDIDSDGDGRLSREEYEAWTSDKEDKDKDGDEGRSQY